jgi:hypothetical protein
LGAKRITKVIFQDLAPCCASFRFFPFDNILKKNSLRLILTQLSGNIIEMPHEVILTDGGFL